jgi:hypothetical protein
MQCVSCVPPRLVSQSQRNSHNGSLQIVELLPLPQPHLRTRTYTQTYPSTQRATQLKQVMARAYYVSIKNKKTVSNTTVP